MIDSQRRLQNIEVMLCQVTSYAVLLIMYRSYFLETGLIGGARVEE